MADPIDTKLIKDPLARIVYETMREWREQQLPVTGRKIVFDLDPGASAFYMILIERIKKMHGSQMLEFSAIVSHQTKEPMIRINWGEMEGVVPPHQAMLIANQLIEITQAAITDAFLFTFLVDNGNSPEEAWVMLGRFRMYRDTLTQLRMPQPSEPIPEDRQPKGAPAGAVAGDAEGGPT